MPYIPKVEREKYDDWIRELSDTLSILKFYNVSGHLNYIITKLLINTVPIRYDNYNTLIGILECVKLELYRRRVVPYENAKIEQNSDVY